MDAIRLSHEQMKIMVIDEFNRRWARAFTVDDWGYVRDRWPSQVTAIEQQLVLAIATGAVVPPEL